MSQSSEIRNLMKQRFQEKQNRIGALPGQLGDGYGHINVTGREHYVYCRLAGTIVEVFNNRVPAENDLLVMVGYDPTQPDLFQILSTRSAVPGGLNGGAVTGYASAKRYQWMAQDGGQDPIFIDKRQYLPLRIGAMTGMLLQVYRDFIWTGTGWVAVNTQNFSLSSYIPTTAGKCALVLITIDNTGAVVKTKGAEVDITALALTDLPAVPAGTVEVLGAVRVYNGQTAIYEARTNTDIIDLRDTWKEASSETTTIADHDHSGDSGDGGAFFLTNLLSTGAIYGQVPTADGTGGITWETPAAGSNTNIKTLSTAGGWCWFSDPRAVYYNGKTYLGYMDGSGSILIRSYDHITQSFSAEYTLHAALEVDDHDNPAILIRESDKRIMVFYSKHSGTVRYYRVSTNPEDVTAFDAEVNIASSLGGTEMSYSSPIQLTGETNDPIYLFWRNPYDANTQEWWFSKSTDDGATWAARTGLFKATNRSAYIKFIQNGTDRIDFFLSDGHPMYDAATSIYHFYYQGGSYYKTDGTLITASLPLAPADVTLVYSGATNKGWIWDGAIDATGKPYAVYTSYVSTSDHRYNYARWTGSAWENHEITAGGGDIIEAGTEVYYSGGIVMDHTDPSIVYLSKYVGVQFEIYQGKTTDGGATWTLTAITSGSSSKQIRPAPVYNHNSDLVVMWMSGTYNQYTDYNTAVMGIGAWETSSGGDMLKSTYDADNNGVVDNSEALNGHADTYFATAAHTHDDRYYTEAEVDALLAAVSVGGALEPLTNGDTTTPELLFGDDADVLMVEVN